MAQMVLEHAQEPVDECVDLFFAQSVGLDDPAQTRFYERQLRKALKNARAERKKERAEHEQRQLEDKWAQLSHLVDKQARDEALSLTVDEAEALV